MNCHVQEVMSSLSTDRTSAYVIGGSIKGSIYIWEVSSGKLLVHFQSHFKEVTCVKSSSSSDYFVTGSSDGAVKVWDLLSLLNSIDISKHGQNLSITPHR
jgi:WD40 repeat protein